MKLSKMVFILLIISNLIGVTLVAINTYNSLVNSEKEILELHATRLKNAIEAEIMVTDILDEVININSGKLSEEEFYRLGAIISSGVVKSSITYIPAGLIEYIYPPEFGEGVVGQNVFDSKITAPDSIKARDSKQTTIQGPYELFEGSAGIVIRNPVFYNGAFWGLIAVAIDAEDLFNYVGLGHLAQQGYEFNLANEDTTAQQSEEYVIGNATFMQMDIANTQWKLGLYVKNKSNIVATDAMFWFLIFLFINFILYYFLQKLEHSRDILAKKLEKDNLTGAYNRVKLIRFYEEAQAKPFALFFIDLNKFKPVNDNYGHKVGDKLLKAYVERLKNEMMNDTLILRLGGDEFVVITPNVKSINIAASIKTKLLVLSEAEFFIDGLSIYISASIGYVLSNEANNLEALLNIADKKMYAEKEKRKTTASR